jgi:hypothetical protein
MAAMLSAKRSAAECGKENGAHVKARKCDDCPMKRLAFAVVPLAMWACGDGDDALPEPEIVHRPRGIIVALAREGSQITMVHERGVDRLDTKDGSVIELAGAEYLVCPDPLKGEREPVAMPTNVAVSGDTLAISLTACHWALWTFDLRTGARRELAPLEPDGDWPGIDEVPLGVTAHEGKIFAAVGRFRIPEIWSFDLRTGEREKIASLGHRMRICNEPLIDDKAIYVGCTEENWSDSTLYRIELSTHEVIPMAPLGVLVDFAQDDHALYVAGFIGPVDRIEKTARWMGGPSPATHIDFPAKKVGVIAVDNGTVFGAGAFDADPTIQRNVTEGVWSAQHSAPGRELAKLRRRDTRFRSMAMRRLVATEDALFVATFSEDTDESALMRIPR